MKRVFLVAISAVLAFGVLIAPVAAVPVTDLTALASYFPADTPVFFALRTDDAFIDELDDLVDTVRDAMPPGIVPPFTLRDALDEGMESFGDDATFDNTFRTWLGDTMAVGVVDLNEAMMEMSDDPPTLVAIAITDRDAAVDFVIQTYEETETEVAIEDEGDFTLLTPDVSSDAFFAIGDDVLLLATDQDLLPLNSDFRSLANDADFGDSLAMLPASDYNALLALNLQDFISLSYAMMEAQAEMLGPSAELITGLESLYANYPRQTLGLTVLDDRSLTIDFAQSAIDYAALEGSFLGNLEGMLGMPPVDLSFAQYIPADVPFALQGTGLGNSVSYVIDVFAVMAEIGVRQEMMDQRRFGDTVDVPMMVEEMDANDVRAFIDLAFAGMTGLNLHDDVLPHVNGTYTLFGRVMPSEATDYTFDSALVFEVTDAAAMQAIMDQLVDALTRYEEAFTYEDGVLVLPGVIRGLFPARFQEDLDAEATFDFLIGLNDDVFAIGSREAVEFALSGDGDSLADDPAYIDAQALFLEGSQQVGYLGFGAIRALVEDVVATMGDGGSEDSTVDMVLAVLDAISSASYSAMINEDGSSVGRLVLTLEG